MPELDEVAGRLGRNLHGAEMSWQDWGTVMLVVGLVGMAWLWIEGD